MFSRFSRSSGHVGGMEEEPSECESGVSNGENGASGEEAATVTEGDENDTEEKRETEPAMSQSTSAIMDSGSGTFCTFGQKL